MSETPSDIQQEKRVVAIDSQIIDNMESCYYKWYLYSLCNWRPRHKSKAFGKGTFVHEALRHYYLAKIAGEDWNNCVKIAMEKANAFIPEINAPLEEIIDAQRAIGEYFFHYKAENWKPLAVEETFSYTMYEDDDLIILYEGIIDLRVQTPDFEDLPVDHKTTSRNDQIHPLSNQFIGYCRARQVKRMTINRIGFQKSLPLSEKMTRHIKSYSTGQQEEWAEDVIHTVKMGILHHDLGMFPRNFTSCDGKYGHCMFTNICELEPEAREFALRVQFDQAKESWDPIYRDKDLA